MTAHGSGCDIVYPLIQRNKYGDKLLGFDINKLRPSNAMEVIQLRLLRLMMELLQGIMMDVGTITRDYGP